MPTPLFFVYLLTLGLVWIFRLAYVGWFGRFLLMCMLIVPPALILLSLPSMLRVRTGLEAPQTLTKGREGSLTLYFQTRTFLPIRRVSVMVEVLNRFTGEKKTERHQYFGLLTGKIQIPLPTDSCGQLQCRIKKLECLDLLGLISLRRKAPEPVSCTVLPEPLAPKVVPDLDLALNTAVRLKPKYGGGYSEEHDLREYRPGDTVNSIHWKLSSKTDKVIVREPLINANQDVYLVLGRIGSHDRGLEVLYWLSLELIQREIPHIYVADTLYEVGNEAEATESLCTILANPLEKPCPYDPTNARCVFVISEGEVQVP